VRVSNPTYSTINAVRVYVHNLTNSLRSRSITPSGITNGVPFVQSQGAVAPGSYVDLVIQYYSPLRILPNPILELAMVPADTTSASFVGALQHINRGLMLPNRTFMVEFMSASNRVYGVQYSSDLTNWKTALPAITGTGNWIQWIDNGQPSTESAPAAVHHRFYRLLELP